MHSNVDVTIIGGGFFGLYLAEYYSQLNKKVNISAIHVALKRMEEKGFVKIESLSTGENRITEICV